MYVKVALPIPRIPAYTYRLENHAQDVLGCRVMVPLGKRIVTGTVVESNVEEVDGVKDIVEVLDETPTFNPALLELSKRVAQYYMCSQGEVLSASIPSGLSPSEIIRVKVLVEPTQADMQLMKSRAPKRAALMQVLMQHSAELTISFLQRALKNTSVADQLDSLQRHGIIEITREMESDKQGKSIRAVCINDVLARNEESLQEVFNELDHKAPKQSLALGVLFLAHERGEPWMSVKSIVKELQCSVSVIESLIDKGYADSEYISAYKLDSFDLETSLSQRNELELTLTEEQQHAIDAVRKETMTGEFSTTLLEGVTGSGKTIVYQRAMLDVVKAGKQVILLVPEISLTPQLYDRFASIFEGQVVLIHSKVGLTEKIDAWNRAKSGQASVIIGPRSAILTPTANLGLIIVDEEHEPSYKQADPAPRYNGRDVAIMRGHIENCPVILGSATPSLESIYNANMKRYKHLVLRHRADGAVMPKVEVVDMLKSKKAGNINGSFSSELLREIVRTVQKKDGVLLFLNRRGFSSQQQCNDCGNVPECANCDVKLTFHKASRSLRCHYCSYHLPAYSACTVCGSLDMHEVGMGTQRIEEELRDFFESNPVIDRPVNIERMDADTTSKKGSHRKMLQRFSDGTTDILVGTQMIAKGLDISRVTLVSVINADQSLFHSDFRASERTLQLLVQVSGRAGRKADKPGVVIIQTTQPDNPTIRTAQTNQLEDWRVHELDSRKQTGYAPFSRYIVITMSSPVEASVEHSAKVFMALIPADSKFFERFPAVAPTVARVRNRYRRIMVIKNHRHTDPSGQYCRRILNAALDSYYDNYASNAVRVVVDVDANSSV